MSLSKVLHVARQQLLIEVVYSISKVVDDSLVVLGDHWRSIQWRHVHEKVVPCPRVVQTVHELEVQVHTRRKSLSKVARVISREEHGLPVDVVDANPRGKDGVVARPCFPVLGSELGLVFQLNLLIKGVGD